MSLYFKNPFCSKYVKIAAILYKKKEKEINIQNQMRSKIFQDLEMEQKCKSMNMAVSEVWNFDYFLEKLN